MISSIGNAELMVNSTSRVNIDDIPFHSMNASVLEKVKRLKLIDKMVEAREKGLIKYIGFSFHDSLPVFKEIVDLFDWDVVQIQYNYMDTAVQATTEGLKYAAGKGMAVVIMEPVKGAALSPGAVPREGGLVGVAPVHHHRRHDDPVRYRV
jgi:uncharacterized protein